MASAKSPDPSTLAPWAEPSWTYSSNPHYNESHRRLRDALRAYINEHVYPHMLDWEAAGAAPQEERLRWGMSGFAFGDVPKQYRPANLPNVKGVLEHESDIFHLLVSVDETARMEGGVGTSLSGASVIGVPPIVAHGTKEQKRRWLPGLFEWKTSFCLGITEPSGGSDVGNLRTTAKKTPDGRFYVVDGTKKWITGAPWATHMTTAVRTGGPGMRGVSVIVIPLDAEGVSRTKVHNSGQNAGGASLVELDNVKVPVENLLGKENEGFKIIMTNFNKERFVMSIQCNRKARTCLTHALRYAHTRHTFGQPLMSHQIIRHKLALLAVDVEAHWAWLEQIATRIQNAPDGFNTPDLIPSIALSKVMGGRMLERAAREAQQIFGGAGYQKGGPGAIVEQISRDLRMMVVGGGSEEIIEDLAVREEIKASKRRGWKL
ncbi:acyl-CoA dehydrogenase NM domain-like protein [Aulographum hederae CBS 113979]|uniref:Acyl-CoA dehydrogenase NM domain-like protein n=1 Tax=Aulographum hederae CBS 113979 TaxID=1176131 RepID=A0A6G1HDX6_9PEZI|nr:acyl-CoA dehydrogenase NM domain-like protein [Aulographum hederae CBS 113979]